MSEECEMTEEVKKIRDGIIRRFCRTILWIDDEINLDKGLVAPKANPLFKNKFDEFTQAGLICHLLGFPEVRQGADPFVPQEEVESAINTCLTLAAQSDVFIVDWMLGGTDSSEYAEQIIQKLVGEDKGFRFIVVLSQIDLSSSSLEGLGFNAMDEALWRNETGQFLLSLRKDEFKDVNLFDHICIALHQIYPDYLHLVALEIAGRVKDLAPMWLSSIPSNADLGLLVERGNTFQEASWRDNLKKCVASNLLEDLDAIILRGDFSSFDEDVLKPSNNQHLDIPVKEGELQTALSGLRNCVRDERPQNMAAKDFKKLLKARNDPDIKALLNGIEAFTEFCEVQSGGNRQSLVCPGAVYNGLIAGSDDIAVCISGACDCLRSPSLLFLIGTCIQKAEHSDNSKLWTEVVSDEKFKGGKTVLRFNGCAYVFCSQPSSLMWKSKNDICSLAPVGVLRCDIVNRLTSRFMTHIRRVGVDQPSISRNLRGEKGLDE